MTFVQSLSRMALGLGIVALAACQTVPQEQAPADADDRAQTVVEPSEELSEEQQAALDQAEYSPLLVFLADFEPQDDWVEVALEDDKIGRASCRERGESMEVGEEVTKKTTRER